MMASIVAPMCAYSFFLFLVWSLLGYVRVAGGLRGEIPPEYFRVGQGPRPSDRIVDIHHHFSNQFELPILFYLGCILALVTESVDQASIVLAWTFVGLRIVHTAIILVKNDPKRRVGPYVLSGLSAFAIWANIFRNVLWS